MDECSICLDSLDANIAVLSCRHKYHYNCIQKWINKTNNISKVCVICEKDTEIIRIINETNKTNDKVYEYKPNSLIMCCNII